MNPYEVAGGALLREYDVEVAGWRSSSSGRAWPSKNQIVTPKPKGPISFSILAHEIGHVAFHKCNGRYPRWREEVEAWEFALAQFGRFGLRGEERAYARAVESIAYAFSKAIRRGVAPTAVEDAYPVWWTEAHPFLSY